MIPIADSHSDFLSVCTIMDIDNRLYDHGSLESLIKGGVSLQTFAVWVPCDHCDTIGCGRLQIEYLQKLLAENSQIIKLCTSKSDLKTDHDLHVILAIESGESVGCSLERIKDVYNDGARMLSLTWNDENAFACGSCAEGGLKDKGIKAIKLMNRLNMALDLSHLNEQCFWEAVELYKGVPCASHSCVYDIRQVPRNLKKDQIKHLIEHKGYIGINFFPQFLKGSKADIEDILDHIEYILAMNGENTVGLGSDFCGISTTPSGLTSVVDFQKIPEAMVKRGYKSELIYKICYGNFAKYIIKFLKNKVEQHEKHI